MRHSTELGSSRVKTLLVMLVLVSACFVAFRVVPPYFADSQLKDKMYEEAKYAQANRLTPEQVRDIIYKEAQQDGIPLRREDIVVEMDSTGTRVSAQYDVTVDLRVYQLTLHFHPSSSL
ncbi:MAG: DUF4845 domain-containing protein [Acidobacteriia bacterium]|nr:DUF4845 domain-containing protein [Terriglobia bacterium]